ncbi:hypothetical protein ACFE04_006141 [Oxalis oulophora]
MSALSSYLQPYYSDFVELDPTGRYGRYNEILGKGASKTVYRQKHKRVNIRAVKDWCRQILKGLLYLHSHDPPVIHRDLKCDNIFINGNQGEVKIGDLGLAAILRKPPAAHCVGTPEFMAPEVYEEAYNELVDIYSFGMCVLEMVTFEYPYSECTHPAQIYKKVVSGKKPDALYKVKDLEVRQFVEKCLATVSLRLSARELLNDHFLQIDDRESDLSSSDYRRELNYVDPLIRLPYLEYRHQSDNSCSNGHSKGSVDESQSNDWDYHPIEIEQSGIELFEHHEDEHSADLDISIKGKRGDDGSIFLRLRIADKEGRIRNIYFPFDIDIDTALNVASEMVAELDIYDQDVTKIADMIDGEIDSLVPQWRLGPGIEESVPIANQRICESCASTQTSTVALQCCSHGCASIYGRFGEITFEPSHSDEKYETLPQSISGHGETEMKEENTTISCERTPVQKLIGRRSHCRRPSFHCDVSFSDNHEDEIQQELRWLKEKYEAEVRQLRDKESGLATKSASHSNIEVFSSSSIKAA